MRIARGPLPGRERTRGENVVPMINLVFLLLIFFLLTATIAPPEPFPVRPPEGASGGEAPPGPPLYLSAAGEIAWGEARGEAVWAALAARDGTEPLVIRADRAAPARRLAEVTARLAALGIIETALMLEAP